MQDWGSRGGGEVKELQQEGVMMSCLERKRGGLKKRSAATLFNARVAQ